MTHHSNHYYTRFACCDLFIDEYKRRASGQRSNIGLRRCRSTFLLDNAEHSTIKIEKYNSVLNCFEETGEIPLNVRRLFGVILQKNAIYVLGGRANGVSLKSVSTIFIKWMLKWVGLIFCSENSLQVSAYALHGEEETVLPEMNLARDSFAWILLRNYIYVFGGFGITGPLNACERQVNSKVFNRYQITVNM